MVMAKSERLKLGYNIFGHFLCSTTVTYLARKATEFGEKRKRATTPFKIIQGDRGR